jgi:hypothetical protein
MTTNELIEYYVDLLIIQYATLPRAQQTIRAYVSQVIADQIYAQTRDAFSISTTPGFQPGTAVGKQLEAVASYRGVQRNVFGLDLSRTYMLMPVYGDSEADTDPGFALYGQTPIDWYFLNYVDNNRPLYALNDEELCLLTQFRAQVQSMLQSVENVDDLLYAFFGNNVGVFETTMTLTYIDLISDPSRFFGIVAATQSLPRPAGVRLYTIRSETLTGFFGFALYGEDLNPDFVGFGSYGSPQVGSFIRYP